MSFEEIDLHSDEVIAYSRSDDQHKVGIFCNFEDGNLEFQLSDGEELLLQSSDTVSITDNKLVIGPCAAAVVKLK